MADLSENFKEYRFILSEIGVNLIKKYIYQWLGLSLPKHNNNTIECLRLTFYDDVIDLLKSMESYYYDDPCSNKTNIPKKDNLHEFAVKRIHDEMEYFLQDVVGKDYKKVQFSNMCTLFQMNEQYKDEVLSQLWTLWDHTRHHGPRVGVILLFFSEKTVKVLTVSYTKNGQWHVGFPKGKPDLGEKIKDTALREFMEEVGIKNHSHLIMKDIRNSDVIYKKPRIGENGSREHFYMIAETHNQLPPHRPDKNEIEKVELLDIDKIPCSDKCKFVSENRDRKGSTASNVNYHMLVLTDVNGQNPVIKEILEYLKEYHPNNETKQSYMKYHQNCR